MKIGIIGSRIRDGLHDFLLTEQVFKKYINTCTCIISGGAKRGGDRFAEILSHKYDIPIKIYYPNWDKYGRSAGFKRNVYIAQDSDMLIVCMSYPRSKGTENTINHFKRLKPHNIIEEVKL